MTEIADWVLTLRLAATRRFADQTQLALLAWTMFPVVVIFPALYLNIGGVADFAGNRLTSGLLLGVVVMALTCLIGWLGAGLQAPYTTAAAIGGALLVALCQSLAAHYAGDTQTMSASAAVQTEANDITYTSTPAPTEPTVSAALLTKAPMSTDPGSCSPRKTSGTAEAEAAICTAGDGRFEVTLVRYESATAMGSAFRARRTTSAGWRIGHWWKSRDPKTYRGRWEHKATTTRAVLVIYDHSNLIMATATDSRVHHPRLALWRWRWA